MRATFDPQSTSLTTPTDSRRLIRPFFMTPDGSKPTSYKRYYDISSWVITQLAFAFATTPFIVLTLPDSLRVWAQVYFYAVVGVAVTSALLASPLKPSLQKRLKARSSRPMLQRNESQESLQGALLGVPVDPGKELDEFVDEIVDEVKKRMNNSDLPEPSELRKQVEDTLSRRMGTEGKSVEEKRKE